MSVTAVRMIDTIGQNLDRLKSFSYWQDRPVLSYTTRSFAATAVQRAEFKHFFGIDQAPNSALFGGAHVKDVEFGAASNSHAAALARAGAAFVAYTFHANYNAMRAAIGEGRHVYYWIADWTANESHALALLASDPAIVGVQWASPTFGGNLIVPGTTSTLRQLNVDLSVGRLDFWLPSPPAPKPKAASGLWRGRYSLKPQTGEWNNEPASGVNVELGSEPLTDYAVIGVGLNTGQHHIKGLDRMVGRKLFAAR